VVSNAVAVEARGQATQGGSEAAALGCKREHPIYF
jgi:hypothetical protein